MNAREFAAQEQAKHRANYEAFVRQHQGANVALQQALLEGNRQLGSQAVPDYAEFLQRTDDPFGFLRKELEEMRSLLLATNPGPELAACTSENLPIIFTFDHEVNAETRSSSTGGMPVVCLDIAVYHWLVFINRMLMRCAERGTNRDERKRDFLDSLRPWTEAWLFDRHPAKPEAIERLRVESCREPFGTLMSVQLTDWQVFWILAHELAHVVLKHPLRVELSPVISRQNEYEADALATRYFLAAINDLQAAQKLDAVVFAQEWSSAAPVLLLMFFSYAETVRWGLGRQDSQTHPLARDRVEALLATFGEELATPAASTLLAFAQVLLMRASYVILDERHYPRPMELPKDVDLQWSISKRIA